VVASGGTVIDPAELRVSLAGPDALAGGDAATNCTNGRLPGLCRLVDTGGLRPPESSLAVATDTGGLPRGRLWTTEVLWTTGSVLALVVGALP
jgi:hypothetical protein